MSLFSPHQLLTTAGSKPYEVAKACIQLKFLSSQYPCGQRTRHWSRENPDGWCTYQECFESQVSESPEHILLHCPAYNSVRTDMVTLCMRTPNHLTHSLVMQFLLSGSSLTMMTFLLDCSTIPEIISNCQTHGDFLLNELFYLSHTWCFAIHREQMKRIEKWIFR